MAATPGTATVDDDLVLGGGGLALAIARMAAANFDAAGARESPYKAEALASLQNICTEAENLAQAIVDEIVAGAPE